MFEDGDYNYGAVRRWARRITETEGNVFKLDKMFITANVNEGSHWCLCVAYVQEKVTFL